MTKLVNELLLLETEARNVSEMNKNLMDFSNAPMKFNKSMRSCELIRVLHQSLDVFLHCFMHNENIIAILIHFFAKTQDTKTAFLALFVTLTKLQAGSFHLQYNS